MIMARHSLLLLCFYITLSVYCSPENKFYMVETGEKEAQPKYGDTDYKVRRFDSSYLFAGEITCKTKGKTKKRAKVKGLERHLFRTNNPGSKYGSNVQCSATYKRTGRCTIMKISCDQFKLKGNDFLYVKRSGKPGLKFKGRNPPKLSSTGRYMKLYFRTNSAAEDTGAWCTVECTPTSRNLNDRPLPEYPGCKTKKGATCAFPFIHKGKVHTGCTKKGHHSPWCSTKTDQNNNHITGHWGDCDLASLCPDIGCETKKGAKCAFPFNHKGVTHTECTKKGHHSPWCSTKTDSNNNHIGGNWDECDPVSLCPGLDVGF